MRPHQITERRDEHTDHFVGDRFSHRETRTTYDTRTEDRAAYAGITTTEHHTVELAFEDAENATMKVRAPFWERRGDLVYVASHRGVGSYVYELHSSDGRHVTEVHHDAVKPIRMGWPLLAAAIVFLVQIQLLHRPPSYGPAIAAGGGLLVMIAGYRAWRHAMLWLSRRRGRRIVIRQIAQDAARVDDIRRTIARRVAG